MDHNELLARMRAEYREMPGLSLTVPQASRLWQMDPLMCERLLAALVQEGVLVHTIRGAFVALPTERRRTLHVRPVVTVERRDEAGDTHGTHRET